MSTANVKVANITQREVKTKFGLKPVFTIHGEDGTKIDFDFKNPRTIGVEIGGTYTVQVESDKFGLKLVKGTVPSMGGSVPTPADGPVEIASPVTRSGVNPTFPVDPVAARNVEVRVAALNAAVRYWENRAVPAERENKEQTEDVIKTAYEFADFISGQREVKSLGEAFASEADASD